MVLIARYKMPFRRGIRWEEAQDGDNYRPSMNPIIRWCSQIKSGGGVHFIKPTRLSTLTNARNESITAATPPVFSFISYCARIAAPTVSINAECERSANAGPRGRGGREAQGSPDRPTTRDHIYVNVAIKDMQGLDYAHQTTRN
ncbi:hypothetical protein J6590_057929 [Homalodisca vitripennis]|nr:hypothetical protein J6590_057929 [Homalodisca vitripennis]